MTMPTEIEINRWVRELLRRHKVKTMLLSDGSVGLLDVPAKWGSVIDDLCTALSFVAAGDGLPKLAPPSTTREPRGE